MACNSIIPSSSSLQMVTKYDVFVSFRGCDTRNGFTDHLFAALHRKGIPTFRDDNKLQKGEAIGPDLLQAIEGSRVFIVVFSKNYASSTWCLRELAKIVDCLKVSSTKRVLPVFYDVDPSEVRKQSGNYERAFVEHEERIKQDLHMLQTWKEALTYVANISGWDVRDKPESTEIDKIVKETTNILYHKFSSVPNDLVGWQSPVEELEKLLHLGSNDVRVVGICGMGGIGKTTLATVLYGRICHQYEDDVRCFIDDLSKIYRTYGATGVQKQFLCQALNEDNLQICNPYQAANLIRARLHQRKVLIVVDNVDQAEQLEKLCVNREWLGAGSRIIIISRDQHILREYRVDVVYNVQLLNRHNALQLFCRKAFKCDGFRSDYKELTYDALEYAGGHPLAIKVLGSLLYGGDVSQWRSALARLREYPTKDIMNVLRISYDGLEDTEKQIFLDIACFFWSGEDDFTCVRKILDIRGFHPDIGIKVLLDKSLITIIRKCEMIFMHDLLKELGRSIVREISPKEPRKWSRLWDEEDLQNVMLENKASKNLKAIVMPHELGIYSRKEPEFGIYSMKADALSQMSRLNLLIIRGVEVSGNLSYLSNEMGYLLWDDYPFTCLPSSFEPDKLVELILPRSNIKQLWEGTKSLYKLRLLNLSGSNNLIKLPDFREVPNLEHLNLEGCKKLERIDPSIGLLKKLISVDLRYCKNLVSVPINILGLSSLEVLYLFGCSKLKMFNPSGTSTNRQSTSSSRKMLNSSSCPRRHEEPVGSLLPSMPNCPCLRALDLSYCNLLQIPDSIGNLHYLERLDLEGNHFVTLPSIKKLSKLASLNLMNCKQLKYLPELPSLTVLPPSRKLDGMWIYIRLGLYIFNCPNLCDWEHCCGMVFSWMIQVIELQMQFSARHNSNTSIIPGRQIPRWFNKQSMGNTIRMNPSPIMFDDNCIGVAFCANFVAHPYPTYRGIKERKLRPQVLIELQLKNPTKGVFMNSIPVKADLVTTRLDQLLLHFVTRQHFIDGYLCFLKGDTHDFDGIDVEAQIVPNPDYLFQVQNVEAHIVPNPDSLFKVQNIGYRWVFREDLQQLNTTMLHSRNSPLLKRKFVTIDEELPHP